MSVEALNNQNEDLLQESLHELKNQIDKPWQVKYLRESKDGKYKIYSYKLVQWWNRGGIKNKYEQQIWKWIEWTQFSDELWNIIDKTTFKAWEIVYLRVPKAKESTAEKAPEMTIDDIMKMTKQEAADLCNLMYHHPLDNSPARYKSYKDKKWQFMLYKGKKLYIDLFKKKQQDGTYVANYSSSENKCFCFYVKKWNNYRWIYLDWSNNIFYKWTLVKNEYEVWLSRETFDMIYDNPEKYKLNPDR